MEKTLLNDNSFSTDSTKTTKDRYCSAAVNHRSKMMTSPSIIDHPPISDEDSLATSVSHLSAESPPSRRRTAGIQNKFDSNSEALGRRSPGGEPGTILESEQELFQIVDSSDGPGNGAFVTMTDSDTSDNGGDDTESQILKKNNIPKIPHQDSKLLRINSSEDKVLGETGFELITDEVHCASNFPPQPKGNRETITQQQEERISKSSSTTTEIPNEIATTITRLEEEEEEEEEKEGRSLQSLEQPEYKETTEAEIGSYNKEESNSSKSRDSEKKDETMLLKASASSPKPLMRGSDNSNRIPTLVRESQVGSVTESDIERVSNLLNEQGYSVGSFKEHLKLRQQERLRRQKQQQQQKQQELRINQIARKDTEAKPLEDVMVENVLNQAGYITKPREERVDNE